MKPKNSLLHQIKAWFSGHFLSQLGDPSKLPQIGLDIDSSSLILVEMSNRLGRLIVHKFFIKALPPKLMESDNVLDPEGLADFIKQVLQEAGIKARHVNIAALADYVATVKTSVSRHLTESQCYAQAATHLKRAFPDKYRQVYYDFVVQETVSGGKVANKKQQKNMRLFAVEKEKMNPRLDAVRQSGLSIRAMDVDAYAIGRVFSLLVSQLGASVVSEPVAVANIDGSSVLMVVINKGKVVYYERKSVPSSLLERLIYNHLQGGRKAESMPSFENAKDQASSQPTTTNEESVASSVASEPEKEESETETQDEEPENAEPSTVEDDEKDSSPEQEASNDWKAEIKVVDADAAPKSPEKEEVEPKQAEPPKKETIAHAPKPKPEPEEKPTPVKPPSEKMTLETEPLVLTFKKMLNELPEKTDGLVAGHILLAGRCTIIPQFVGFFKEKVGLPTSVATPFADVKFGPSVDQKLVNIYAPASLMACGLAMHGFEK